MIDWDSILRTTATASVIVGGIAWFAKTITKQMLSRNIEAYRAQLASEGSREIEALKHQLQMQALERSTTFVQLHSKRSEVVAGLYERLVGTEESVENFIDPRRRSTDEGADQLYNAAFDALRDLYLYFRRHRIYFSPALCATLQKLFQAMHTPAWSTSYFHAIPAPSRAGSTEEHAIRKQEWTKFREAVPPVMTEVEVEFRRLLGVDYPADLVSLQRESARVLSTLTPSDALPLMASRLDPQSKVRQADSPAT